MFSFQQLLEAPDQDEALEELIELLQRVGFEPTNWSTNGWQRSLLQIGAYVYSQVANRASETAKQTNIDTASSDGLTVLAENFFNNEREPGQKTIGNIGLTLEAEKGPYTVAAKDIRITDGNVFFTNSNAITLSESTSVVTASFEAEEIGEQGNIPNGATLSLVTTLDGVSVNTVPEDDSTSWITTAGISEESDERLKLRCSTKWSTLATNEVVEDRIIYTALSSSADLVKTYVNGQNPFGSGTIGVWCGGELAPAPSGTISTVYQSLTGTLFNGAERIGVFPTSASYLDKNISVYFNPSFEENEITASVKTTLDSIIASSSVGGETFGTETNIFPTDTIIDEIRDIDGVQRVTLDDYSDISLISITGQPGQLSKPVTGYDSLLTFIKLTR